MYKFIRGLGYSASRRTYIIFYTYLYTSVVLQNIYMKKKKKKKKYLETSSKSGPRFSSQVDVVCSQGLKDLVRMGVSITSSYRILAEAGLALCVYVQTGRYLLQKPSITPNYFVGMFASFQY